MKRSGVLTDGDIISHVGTVFVDGTDTSANVLHFVLYELAANPETQDILKKEIDEMWISNEGETISFESIQGMKYLDALMNGNRCVTYLFMVLTCVLRGSKIASSFALLE